MCFAHYSTCLLYIITYPRLSRMPVFFFLIRGLVDCQMFLSLLQSFCFIYHQHDGIVRSNCRVLSAFLFPFLFFFPMKFFFGSLFFPVWLRLIFSPSSLVLHIHQSITLWSIIYLIFHLRVSPCCCGRVGSIRGGWRLSSFSFFVVRVCLSVVFKYLDFYFVILLFIFLSHLWCDIGYNQTVALLICVLVTNQPPCHGAPEREREKLTTPKKLTSRLHIAIT